MALFIGATALFPVSFPIRGQISSYPFVESFDSTAPPDLPSGWSSSRHRNPGSDDFTLTATLPHSEPNAVLSTNATIEQWLISPVFDFSNVLADTMTFNIRRSSSHRAVLIIEASLDSGRTYTVRLGDGLTNTGTTDYLPARLSLSPLLSGKGGVRFRWRLVPDQVGVTGTLRIDDLRITGVYLRDMEFTRLSTLPEFPHAGESVMARAVVRNAGVKHVQGVSVELFADANGDTCPQADEQIASAVDLTLLASGDSLTVTLPLGTFPAGECFLIGKVVHEGDQNMENNLLGTRVAVGYTSGSVLVNEIMFEPPPGGAEYVELMNVSENAVDLFDWTLADRSDAGSSATGTPLADVSRPLYPGEFFVLGADSLLLDFFPYLREVDPRLVVVGGRNRLLLNNEGDDVVVRDHTGHVIDSVAYFRSWHNRGIDDTRGRALEKIRSKGYSNDARNWSSCTVPAGGTPGKVNSINASLGPPNAARLSVYPNPFSPDGDGIDDFVVIRYHIRLDIAMLNLKIFDVRGRLVRHLANNEPTGSQGEIIWDGRDEDGERARIGPYILFLEALNGTPGIIETTKAVVILATRL